MKRGTLRIALCLFLGVVTTVGVAWGLASFVDFTTDFEIAPTVVEFRGRRILSSVWVEVGFGRRAHEFNGILRSFREGEPVPDPVTWRMRGMITYSDGYWKNRTTPAQPNGWDVGPEPLEHLPRWSAIDDASLARFVESEEVCGWPMYALWCSTSENIFGDSRRFVTQPQSALHFNIWEITAANDEVWSDRQLALVPIFPGFIINTLFYAVIWCGVFCGLETSRRTIRRRRGRCVKCGYDLCGSSGGESGCSECGWNRDARRPS